MTTKQKLLLKLKEVSVIEKKTIVVKIPVKSKKAVKNNIIINGDALNEDKFMDEESINLSISGSEIETYITPVYGVKMRVSMDNKYIFNMEFKLVAVVVNDKNIDWVEK